MKSAAKRRNFFSAIIALALLFCASHVASANVLEISKTRAELKTDLGQNRVGESLFYSVKHGENYDSLEAIALESSVAPRTVDDLLVNGKVPDRTNGAFHRWFDELSTDDFNTLWADSSAQSTIRQRLLFKGGHHEWLVRARANVFKSWGLSVKDIANTRQLTNRVNFANNPRGGVPGGHVGFPSQSKVWHNELIGLVDQANDFNHFKRLLNDFADLRLDGGRRALPRQLRLN